MTNATRSKSRPGRQTSAERRRVSQRKAARQRVLWFGVAIVAVTSVAGAWLLAGGESGGDEGPARAEAVSIDRAPGPQLEIGEQVPAFSAPGLDGGTVSWRDVGDGPAVLVVWASWCPHCQAELPVLVPATQAREGIALLSVTTAVGQEPGPAPAEFLEAEGLSLATAVDDEAGSLMRGLGVSSFPTVYYVGGDGAVRAVTIGESAEGAIESGLDAIQRG